MASNKSMVYVHTDLNGCVFYVGCGINNRPYDKEGRPKEWRKIAVNGFTVEIIEEFDNKYTATTIESLLIEFFIRKNGRDSLVNKLRTKKFIYVLRQEHITEKINDIIKEHIFFDENGCINFNVPEKKSTAEITKFIKNSNMSAIDGLIEFFGNSNFAANALRVNRSLVDSWVNRGFIPYKRGLEVESATDGAIPATHVWQCAAKARHHGG